MQQPGQRYGRVAISLHWLMVVGVVLAVGFGLGTVYINDTQTSRSALEVHQTVGFIMLLLALARLVWRFTHKPPPAPEGMPVSQKVAAALMHWTLYLFLLGMPISGYVGLAARGRPITVFGLFDLPHVVPRSFDLSGDAQTLHYYAQFAMYALIVLHIAAALYHHFILKDGILARMLPQRKSRVATALQNDTV